MPPSTTLWMAPMHNRKKLWQHGLHDLCKQGTVCLFDRCNQFPQVFPMTRHSHQVFCYKKFLQCYATTHLLQICKTLYRFCLYQALRPYPKTVLTHRRWLTIGALASRLPNERLRLQHSVVCVLCYIQPYHVTSAQMIDS